MNWQHVYDAFPVNRELIWLNNCGTTPAGAHVVAAVQRFLEGYSRRGILTDAGNYAEFGHRIKTILGKLLGCRERELALIHNTAEGMNFLSRGIALFPGDEIVLLENEYPSNVYPWRHWAQKGVSLVHAPMAQTPEMFLEKLAVRLNARTRVVAVSAVHWCTGMPLPIAAIGRLCRERDILLIVDGAQGVGMQPMDVAATGISAMAFSAWKWLMGPLGLGVLYLPEENLEKFQPVFQGTESVVNDQQYLPYKTQLKPTADRFTFSTAGLVDWAYFSAALSFLEDIGFDAVRSRIYALSDFATQRLMASGLKVVSTDFATHPTGIVVCEKPGVAAAVLVERLGRAGIVATERLGRVRLSPHIYNSFDQIDRAVEVLSTAR